MKYLNQITALTYYNMRSRYRKTLAGLIWVIASPIITFIVQAVVFKYILKMDIHNYPTFLLVGLLPWFFISQTVTTLANSIVSMRELFLGVKVNPLIFISSQVLDNFINYMIATIVLIFSLLMMNLMTLTFFQVVLFFINSLVLFIFVLSLTSLISFLHVFYRDVQYIIGFVMNLAFYITPIFYQVSFVDPRYQWLVEINIFYPVISMFQNSIYILSFDMWMLQLAKTLGITAVLVSCLVFILKMKMKDFYINV